MHAHLFSQKIILILLAVVLTACQGISSPQGGYSPNYRERPEDSTINILIIHHTVVSADEALRLFTEDMTGV